jgi:hypothetical protein
MAPHTVTGLIFTDNSACTPAVEGKLETAPAKLLQREVGWLSYYSGVTGYAWKLIEIFASALKEEISDRVIVFPLCVAIFRSFPINIVLQALVFAITHEYFDWGDLDRALYFFLPALMYGWGLKLLRLGS